ncbi:hypothetical protein CSKR_106584 [Clonorchis sinensis]|uniref:Uncharacterized protein n=1 Tax=Clonorchis sinensis TaxID=79923 RepID=A0A3R7DHH9_CLOSI|nr:hypothetical protein CSKR_106584 [Clonorchis sinensis]
MFYSINERFSCVPGESPVKLNWFANERISLTPLTQSLRFAEALVTNSLEPELREHAELFLLTVHPGALKTVVPNVYFTNISIDSEVSIFNTDVSPPQNRCSSEGLNVKKRINMDGGRTYSIPATIIQRMKVTLVLSWKMSHIDSTQAFFRLFHILLPDRGLAISLLAPL